MSFSVAAINQAVAEAVPDREALVFRDRRFSFAEVADRTNRLANLLIHHGLGVSRERAALNNWECGQDRVALYLFNGNEYLEGMLGAFKARAVPFNVNYRYVAEEIRYLFTDARPRAVIYHRQFSARLEAVLRSLPPERLPAVLIQVEDGSGAPAPDGALDYEQALRGASPRVPNLAWSADDIYLLYTGGTTGHPKGVLWRQGDSVVAQLAGRNNDGTLVPSLEAFAERARQSRGHRVLPTPPFMHGAGTYMALATWHGGNTVVVQDQVEHLDPDNLVDVIERERVNMMLTIGDAFGRPLLEAIRRREKAPDCLKVLYNSGAILSPAVKEGLLERMPGLRVVDGLGSSETGPQALHVSQAGTASIPDFRLTSEAVVLAEDRRTVLQPDTCPAGIVGWLAKRGSVPLGYLGDQPKTEATFPVIQGERHVISGDRVRLGGDGRIEFLGRDSFTVNSGGEKIFVEEVEQALMRHPAVADCIVTSRASERWGEEVVAVVALLPGASAAEEDLNACAGEVIARYKLPKAYHFVGNVRRGDNGKADYRWARSLVRGEA